MGLFSWLSSLWEPAKLRPAPGPIVSAAKPKPDGPLPTVARKRRLHFAVGVNDYIDSPENQLRGAAPDARDLTVALASRGWQSAGPMLLDFNATKSAILSRLDLLCTTLQPGEAAIFSMSSHGTLTDDPREPDGQVEALCPSDALVDWPRNLITAYDIAERARKLPEGALLVIFADACHSGVHDVNLLRGMGNPHNYRKPRALQLPGWITASSGRIRSLPDQMKALTPTHWTRTVLLSGCQSQQTSADTYEDGHNCGAATWALRKSLGQGTLERAHGNMLSLLKRRYEQRPVLEGSAANVREVIL